MESCPRFQDRSGNDPTLLIGLATVGLILGFIVLLGALMLHYKPANKKAWGIMIIAFSIPSVIMGGGFIIGFILGIIGGKLALSEKPKNASNKGSNNDNIIGHSSWRAGRDLNPRPPT